MAGMTWGACTDPGCTEAHLVDPQTQQRRHRRESRVGRSGRANKSLACRHCGYRFQEWMDLWVMQMHYELWHDTDRVDLIMADRNAAMHDITGEQVDVATSEEITRTLKALQDAVVEARQATADLHSARKDAAHFFKEHARKTKEQIEATISVEVGRLEDDARRMMGVRISEVIDGIEADWREKLGLS